MQRLSSLWRLLRSPPSPPSSHFEPTRRIGPVFLEWLPLELRTFEIFRHLDVSSLLNYCSTNHELYAFSCDPQTWRSLIRSTYHYNYHGSYPRQMYQLAEILSTTQWWERYDVPLTLRNIETAEDIITQFTSVGTFRTARRYRSGPMLVFTHPTLIMHLWMDSRGFTIGLTPTSRQDGFIMINSIYQLSTRLAQPIIKLIRAYQHYLETHPVKPRRSPYSRQYQLDHANLVTFIQDQEHLIPTYVMDLFHLHGPSRSPSSPDRRHSIQHGRRKTVTT